MSDGVILSRDAARRTRDAVRRVEAGNVNGGAPQRRNRSRVYVQLGSEVGSGEYQANAVKRDGSAWVTAANDPFNDGDINVFELNGVTDLDAGLVVEVYPLYDNGVVFWAFGATGGAASEYDGPWAITLNTSSSVKFGGTRSTNTPDIASIGPYSTQYTSSFNESLTPPGSGTETWWAWVQITQFTGGGNAGDPIVNRFLTNTAPTYDKGYNTVILATLTVGSGGIEAIRQDHRGHIHIPQTIVEFATSAPFNLTYNSQSSYDELITTAEECSP